MVYNFNKLLMKFVSLIALTASVSNFDTLSVEARYSQPLS